MKKKIEFTHLSAHFEISVQKPPMDERVNKHHIGQIAAFCRRDATTGAARQHCDRPAQEPMYSNQMNILFRPLNVHYGWEAAKK